MSDEQKALDLIILSYKKQQEIKALNRYIGNSFLKCKKFINNVYDAEIVQPCLFDAYNKSKASDYKYAIEELIDCPACKEAHKLIKMRKVERQRLGRLKRNMTILAKKHPSGSEGLS